MNKLRKLRVDYLILHLIFAVGVMGRLPYLKQGLPPYVACDEGFFANDVFRMINEPSLIMKEFRSGAMNSWPVLPFGIVANLFSDLTYTNLLIIGRLILPITLASATVFPLHYILKRMGVATSTSLLTVGLLTVSPFVLSQSESWYPDSYIMFISSLFILQFLRLIQEGKGALGKNNLLIFLFAAGVSVKHNFAFHLVVIFLFEYFHRGSFSRNIKNFRFLKDFISNYIGFLVKSILVFFAMNYSIFLNFVDFLRAMNGNRRIYAVVDLNFLPGTIFYVYNLVFSPLGMLGAVVFVLGVYVSFRKDRNLTLAFIGYLLLFVLVAGFPKQALARNINQLLPLFFVFFAIGVQKLRDIKKPWYPIILAFLMAASLVRSEVNFYSTLLKPDSYVMTEDWLRKNLQGEVVGVNYGCIDRAPAFVAGSIIKNVKDMSDQLDYYLFSSYGEGPFFDFYRQQNIYVSSNPRYLHFYHFNNTKLFSGWDANRTLESYTPQGYRIVREFSGSGPTFVLLEKTTIN
jgi:hypothetical protein